MANSRYLAGRRLEWEVRDRLRADGYFVVRSAGSKTPVDLVAIHPQHGTLIVQCKRGGASRATKMALAKLAADLHVRAAVAEKHRGFPVAMLYVDVHYV